MSSIENQSHWLRSVGWSSSEVHPPRTAAQSVADASEAAVLAVGPGGETVADVAAPASAVAAVVAGALPHWLRYGLLM